MGVSYHSAMWFVVVVTAVTCGLSRAETKDGRFHENGTCLQREAAQNFDPKMLEGTWYELYTNYEAFWISNFSRSCMENKFSPVDYIYFVESAFIDVNGMRETLFKPFLPKQKEPGKYVNYVKVEGKWKEHWHYTYVYIDDEALLEYACTVVGDQHKEFHRIKGRNTSLAESKVDKLKKLAEDFGDIRPFGKYDQTNCTYLFV